MEIPSRPLEEEEETLSQEDQEEEEEDSLLGWKACSLEDHLELEDRR